MNMMNSKAKVNLRSVFIMNKILNYKTNFAFWKLIIISYKPNTMNYKQIKKNYSSRRIRNSISLGKI